MSPIWRLVWLRRRGRTACSGCCSVSFFTSSNSTPPPAFPALRAAWQQRNAFADLPVRILGEAQELAGTCAGSMTTARCSLDTPEGRRRVLSGEGLP